MKIFEDGAYRTAGANLFTLFAFALLGFFRTVSGRAVLTSAAKK